MKSMFRNTGDFFRNQQWKEILTILFFLLLSFGFWVLQSLQEDYERRVELPLRYKNIPPEWILSEDNPKKITLLLKDKGSTLMYYLWKAHFLPVDISLSNLSYSPDQYLHVTSQALESAMSKQLMSSTSIISIDPHEIKIKYDTLSSRQVSVVANVIVNTQPGFQISGSIKISQPEVRLYGSNKILDTLQGVYTKFSVIENVSDTKELIVALDLPAGVKADCETVKLTVPVEEFTEKRIHLPVLCCDIPVGYALRIFPSTVEVVCDIPLSLFNELTDDELEIQLSFDEFKENRSTGKLPAKLTKQPSWVVNTVIIPNEVEFIIEQSEHD
ncbi:MAG: YbbR-like domain-containing protein [Tannerella sp.]|nr:YbbR-like domain-containing protein [Tannerella sp.]